MKLAVFSSIDSRFKKVYLKKIARREPLLAAYFSTVTTTTVLGALPARQS
jgi:hypothetical protein